MLHPKRAAIELEDDKITILKLSLRKIYNVNWNRFSFRGDDSHKYRLKDGYEVFRLNLTYEKTDGKEYVFKCNVVGHKKELTEYLSDTITHYELETKLKERSLINFVDPIS